MLLTVKWLSKMREMFTQEDLKELAYGLSCCCRVTDDNALDTKTTIELNEAPRLADKAATLPPPGA